MVLAAAWGVPAQAHHAYSWLDPRTFVLNGAVEEILLGNPHGHLTVRAADGLWDVELSDVTGNEKAGFFPTSVNVGDTIRVTGHRSRDPTARTMRGDRLQLNGATYDIFPRSIFALIPDPMGPLSRLFAAIQEWPGADVLRDSRYAYPIANAFHILGFILLIGGILPVDIRLLGGFRPLTMPALSRVLEPMAAIGLGLALLSGLLIFTVKPAVYAANPAFLAKMVLVALGTLNALSLRFGGAWRVAMAGGVVAGHLKARAALSILIWLAALTAGRFIAFVA